MTNLQKSVLALFGVMAILGAGAFMGFSPFLKVINNVEQIAGASPTGTTFNSAKVAAISWTPSTAAATSTSILNTDANDRYVIDNVIACGQATTSYTAITGGGLANLIFKAATTSTANPAVISNTNLIMSDTIATSSGIAPGATGGFPVILVASSSVPAASPILTSNVGVAGFWFDWPAGSYLTFWANATSTTACTVGVHYIAS